MSDHVVLYFFIYISNTASQTQNSPISTAKKRFPHHGLYPISVEKATLSKPCHAREECFHALESGGVPQARRADGKGIVATLVHYSTL